tara:strand:+ start:368 stop:652 length:285 start_codon:yes stop_codon:yes gene_type:complete
MKNVSKMEVSGHKITTQQRGFTTMSTTKFRAEWDETDDTASLIHDGAALCSLPEKDLEALSVLTGAMALRMKNTRSNDKKSEAKKHADRKDAVE